jgi:HSP20 family molecular chaperone IbpA
MTNQIKELEKQQAPMEGAPENTRPRKLFVPRADIYESAEKIIVYADMPGVCENSLDITLEKNVLTINGYVESEAPAGYTLAYAEYKVGDYRRAFTLSNEIDREGIEATMKNGVLKLTLPKSKDTQPRKITVKGE